MKKDSIIWRWTSYLVLSYFHFFAAYGQAVSNLLTPLPATNGRLSAEISDNKWFETRRSRLASINFSRQSPFISDQINFNLFNDLNLPVRRVAHEAKADGTEIWYGRTPDPAFDHLSRYCNVIVTANPAKQILMASIFRGGKEYQIKPVLNTGSARLATGEQAPVHWVIEKAAAGSAFCQSITKPAQVTKPASKASVSKARLAASEADCQGVYHIDVLVGFSYSAAERVGDATLTANQMIAEVNNGLANSLVENVRLRLVGVAMTTNNAGIVPRVLDDGPKWFAAEMEATGADYLAVVQSSTGAPDEASGYSGVPSNVSVNHTYDPTGIFRHEIGHSVGGQHCPDESYGITPYASGFNTGNWATHLCGNTVNFYSTPAVKDNLGKPIGDAATADMARLWRERAEEMASVRTHVQPYECSGGTCPSWGPYITGKNLGDKPGLVLLSEVMAPNECVTFHTYWSSLNFYLGPRGGYAGIQRKTDDGGVYNNIFSMWDLQDSNTPQSYAEYQLPGEFVSGFGGEGTGLHTHHNMPWTPGVWYTTVVRRWYTGDGKTRIGFFMYDYGTRKWTHYVTIVTPENDAYFTGSELSGFLEKFSGEPQERCGYWRNFWKLNNDGSWNKATQIKASAGTGAWKAEQTSSTEIKLYSCGAYTAPQSSYEFNLTIPETRPSVVTTAFLSRLTPVYSNDTLTINWGLDETQAPQLSYRIEVFDNPNFMGTPLAQVSSIQPEKRSAVMSAKGWPQGKYYVRLQVSDIFEQQSNVLSAYFTNTVDCGCRK